jgi:hypothetical protein
MRGGVYPRGSGPGPGGAHFLVRGKLGASGARGAAAQANSGLVGLQELGALQVIRQINVSHRQYVTV